MFTYFAATSGSWLTEFSNWAVKVMETIGAPGAGFVIAIENIFPPLPSEVVLPLAGLAASQGSFTLFEALFWTTAGSVLGAFALYYLGAVFGLARLRTIAERMPLMKVSDVDSTVAWFNRHGGKAVFFGRMIPVFRSLISIPAGVTKMPLLKFGLLTSAGSLIWNGLFVLSGFYLGESDLLEKYADILQYVVIAAVGLAIAAVAYVRIHTHVKKQLRVRRERLDK